jgi:ABC-type uncharacterized transport system involved in gliding motility auxiliary subunit
MLGIKRSGPYFKFFTYLAIVVLINLAGITMFARFDLTENKVYSISEASRKVVSTLSEPMTINVFFTKNLPAPHNNTERYLHDLLEEYAIYANRYFNYRFVNVSPDEGDLKLETRQNQELAKSYGIDPIQIQAIEEDEVKFQKAYMGLVLIHGDIIERIPTITSTDGLEYQLTTAMIKLNNKVSALLNLKEKIQIKLYFSSSLKQVAPFMGLSNLSDLPQKIENVVKTLNQKHFDTLKFEYLDPTLDPSLATEVRSKKYNLLNLKWPAIPDKNIEAGNGIIGLVMEYDSKAVTIHLMRILKLPIIGTRYEMADMDKMGETIGKSLESLIDINEDLGYLADHGTLPLTVNPLVNPADQNIPEVLNNFRTLVSRNYTIKNVNLKDQGIPNSLNSLVIVRPVDTFTDYDLFQIDQFLMQGKSLAIFLDKYNEFLPPQQRGLISQGPRYTLIKTGLEKLLSHYGIRAKNSYVLDENCFKQEMPTRLGGGERPIYWAPIIENRFINKKQEFMKNITQLVAVKASPLEVIEARLQQTGLKAHRLFASSEKSWEMRGRINLNPMFISPPQSAEEQQSLPLAYILEGEFTSYFENKPIPEKKSSDDAKDDGDDSPKSKQEKTNNQQSAVEHSKIESEGQFITKGKPAKIFLMASSEMVKDTVIDDQGRSINSVFLMNLLDALNGREDIALLRSKKQRFNPLTATGAFAKTFIKSFNIAGLPILVVIFGLLVWFRRASRKKHIQMMFQK